MALVIGNSNYATSKLQNPKNDADDMALALEKIGFEVTLEHDLNAKNMDIAIREFSNRLDEDGGYGFFYFAGHGMQVEKNNYLIPIDLEVDNEIDVKHGAISVNYVLDKMQRTKSSLNLMVLDSCRNNPFPEKSRSFGGRGLARIKAPQGSMIVYATAPNAIASDGDGRNGTFTEHFLKHLVEPGLTLTQIVRRTKSGVRKATNDGQQPWDSDDLTEDKYILYPKSAINKPSNYSPIDSEKLLWNAVLANNSVDQYAAYIAAYPSGKFIDLANSNIDQLENPADIQFAMNTQTDNSALANNAIDEQTRLTVDENVLAILSPNAADINVQQPISQLTIDTIPADARVRIMNIVEKYKPGMQLEKNQSYDIYVQSRGYISWRRTVYVNEATTSIGVELTKKANNASNSATANIPGLTSIQSGKFNMGCSKGDRLCQKTESPVTEVAVSPYQIGAAEVTVGEFRQFVLLTGYKTDAEKNAGDLVGCLVRTERGGLNRDNSFWSWKAGANWKNPGYPQTDNHPVTCVSWNDAVAYTEWMSEKFGRRVRLPTEAEWEHAARAGSTNRYGPSSSSKNLCDYENGADESKSQYGAAWKKKMKCKDGFWNTAPVKSYKPNKFGLYDMLGNVHEWTQDVWQSKISLQTSSTQHNVVGKASERTLRGGAWDKEPTRLRLSVRSPGTTTKRASMIGFRIVRELEIQAAK